MRNTPNLLLKVWDNLMDRFNHTELAQNWDTIDAHDHTGGTKGLQIPTGGIVNQAVDTTKINNNLKPSAGAGDTVESLRALGTGAGQALPGTHISVTNARVPTGAAGGVLAGSYPNPGFAVDMATQAELDARSLLLPRAAADGFPTSPVNGQQVIIDVGGSRFWHFQYDAPATNWKFIGGPDLIVRDSTEELASAGGTNLCGPTLSIPLKGDYAFWIGHRQWHSSKGVYTGTLLLRRSSDGQTIGDTLFHTDTDTEAGVLHIDCYTELYRLVQDAHSALKGGTYGMAFSHSDPTQGRSKNRVIVARPIFCSN